jgi:hypothetical protein
MGQPEGIVAIAREEMLDGEEWRDVAGYEGLYQVSNMGRVKSMQRYVATYYGRRLMCGRILKPKRAGRTRQYKQVCLGSNDYRYIHRLVATSFIENPHKYPTVNHKDENHCRQLKRGLRAFW